MPMAVDWSDRARELLGDTWDGPADARALRISGIYATLYLHDPFLFSWCGLACFVSRRVRQALDLRGGGYQQLLAGGNRAIYHSIVPYFLAFRAGESRQGSLLPAMELLREADRLAGADPGAARVQRDRAVKQISTVEQVEVVQPFYGQLGHLRQWALKAVFGVRLGWDSAAPQEFLRVGNPAVAADRMAWVETRVLPWFARLADERPEALRSDIDRIRRESRFQVWELP
jgi:hypothetical protein